MENNKPQKSFDDLVFEGRNKEYGAYELRKNYSFRLKKAFAFMILFSLSIYAFSLINLNKNDLNIKDDIHVVTTLDKYDLPPEEKDVPKPPEPPKQEAIEEIPQAKVEYSTIKLVDEAPPINKIDTIQKSVIDTENKDGIESNNNQVIDKEPTKEPEKVITIIPLENKKEEVKTNVDVQAKFNGNWGKFLTEKLEILVENSELESGTVIVRFIVDINGNISDIKSISGPVSLRKIAEQAISSSGKWIPAEVNGMPVKAYRTQPIRFVGE